MKNTATFEEFFKDKEPTLLYNMKQFKFWDYIDEINKEYTEQLQAKHEEEREQAVIDAYVDGCDLGTYEQNTKEARQYYEANFKTKEL